MTTNPVMSITDEQIADIETLASDACQYASQDWFTALDLSAWFADDDALFMAAASPFAVRALISRLRAAERDAARYRYLRSGSTKPSFLASNPDAKCLIDQYMFCETRMDTAIDAAMKGEQQ